MPLPRKPNKLFKVDGTLLKVVPHYGDHFAVSIDGKRIWSREKLTRNGRILPGKWLQAELEERPYNTVWKVTLPLYNFDQSTIKVPVGRLVALAYIGLPPQTTYVIAYKDGNKLNNHVDNLEWITRSEAMRRSKTDKMIGPSDSELYEGEEYDYRDLNKPQRKSNK